jgi:ubiquinone/menaquinone biosynthesis C-methylase UbiE
MNGDKSTRTAVKRRTTREERRVTQTKGTKDLHVAFIGAGAMAEAIVRGVLARGVLEPGNLTASDRDTDRLTIVREKFRIQTTTENRAAARKARWLYWPSSRKYCPRCFKTSTATSVAMRL